MPTQSTPLFIPEAECPDCNWFGPWSLCNPDDEGIPCCPTCKSYTQDYRRAPEAYEERLGELRTNIKQLENGFAVIATLLPSTFYAGYPLAHRVQMLVEQWQRIVPLQRDQEATLQELADLHRSFFGYEGGEPIDLLEFYRADVQELIAERDRMTALHAEAATNLASLAIDLRDRDAWIWQYNENSRQIGEALDRVREKKRDTGLPTRSDAAEVRALVNRVQELERQEEKNCGWKADENGIFKTGCGHLFFFDSDGIKENEFAYCPFCRGRIIELTDK